jgi:cytochrome P450
MMMYPPGPNDQATIIKVAMAFRDPAGLTPALMEVAEHGDNGIASVLLPQIGRVNVITNLDAVAKVYGDPKTYGKASDLMYLMQGLTLGRNNWVFSNGDIWKLQHDSAKGFTHPNAVRAQVPHLVKIIHEFFDYVDESGGVITRDDWSKLMFAMGSQIFFSRNLGDEEPWLAENIDKMFTMESELAGQKMKPTFATDFAVELAEYAALKAEVDGFIADEVKTRQGMDEPPADLITALMDMMSNHNVQELIDQGLVDPTLLADDVRTAFVAATETTAALAGFLSGRLYLDPDYEAKVANQLRQLGEPGYQTWKEANYFRWAAQEALRIDVIAPTGLRRAMKRKGSDGQELPNPTLLGYDIEGLVVVPVMGIHHMEKYHPFHDRFLPEERFGNDAIFPVARWSYLPLGAGERICLGKPLAETEISLLNGVMYNRYDDIILLPPFEDGVVTVQETTRKPHPKTTWKVVA